MIGTRHPLAIPRTFAYKIKHYLNKFENSNTIFIFLAAVNSCNAPPYVKNAVMYNYVLHNFDDHTGREFEDSATNDIIVEENNPVDTQQIYTLQTRYPFGAQVAYKCLPGFKMRGEFLLTCYESGCWHPNIRPECDPQPSLIGKSFFFRTNLRVSLLITKNKCCNQK